MRNVHQSVRSIVTELVKTHGSQRAVARLLGVSESRLGKLLNHSDAHLSVYNALLLSKIALLPPGEVLRAAGKQREADIIDELWGPPPEVPKDVQRFIQRWRTLSPEVRSMVLGLIR